MKYWKLFKILMKTENTLWRLRRIIDISNTLLIDQNICLLISQGLIWQKFEEPESWDKSFKDSKTYDLKI